MQHQTNIQALIVDDEKPARDELNFLLKNIGAPIEVVGEAENSEEALCFLKENSCDLLFLDIEMPEHNGFELLKMIQQSGEDAPFIIFVTAYDHFALQAFDVEAVDYLLKPVSPKRLELAIQKVIERSQKLVNTHEEETARIRNMLEKMQQKKRSCQRLALYLGDKLIPIESGQLIYATVEDKITFVFTAKGKFSFNGTLNELEDILSSPDFFRGHKSFLINLTLIESIDIWFNGSYQVKLKGTEQPIPISRNQAKEFKEILNIK